MGEAEGNETAVFQPFQGARVSPEWRWFLASSSVDKNHRRKAKCVPCGQVLEGRPPTLRKHLLHYCLALTDAEREEYLQDCSSVAKRKQDEVQDGSVSEGRPLKKPATQQRRAFLADTKLLEALLLNSTPFTLVDTTQLKEFARGLDYDLPDSHTLTQIYLRLVKPISSCLIRLQEPSTTLDLALSACISVYLEVRRADLAMVDPAWKSTALSCINVIVKHFSEPIFFVALFLNPSWTAVSISKLFSKRAILREILTLAKKLRFDYSHCKQIVSDFEDFLAHEISHRSDRPLDAWTWWTQQPRFLALRSFALKLLLSKAHLIALKQLFSRLAQTRPKPRGRVNAETLNFLAIVRSAMPSILPRESLDIISDSNVVELDGLEDEVVGDDLQAESSVDVDLNSNQVNLIDTFFDLSDTLAPEAKKTVVVVPAEEEREGDFDVRELLQEILTDEFKVTNQESKPLI